MFVWSKIPPHWGAGRVWGHPLWSSWSAMQVCPLSVVPWRNPLIWQFGSRTRALACGLSSCPCQASPVAAIVAETALHLRQTSVLHPSSSLSTSLPAHCHHFTHSISCWTFLNPNTKSVKVLTHLDLQHWKIQTCEICKPLVWRLLLYLDKSGRDLKWVKWPIEDVKHFSSQQIMNNCTISCKQSGELLGKMISQ